MCVVPRSVVGVDGCHKTSLENSRRLVRFVLVPADGGKNTLSVRVKEIQKCSSKNTERKQEIAHQKYKTKTKKKYITSKIQNKNKKQRKEGQGRKQTKGNKAQKELRKTKEHGLSGEAHPKRAVTAVSPVSASSNLKVVEANCVTMG
jgi:hypothetical protein